MRERRNRQGIAGNAWSLTISRRTLARCLGTWPQRVPGHFVRLVGRYWQVFLVIAGLLVQVVLTVLMWQLVDLTIALMEVWAELARKHLEIVLS